MELSKTSRNWGRKLIWAVHMVLMEVAGNRENKPAIGKGCSGEGTIDDRWRELWVLGGVRVTSPLRDIHLSLCSASRSCGAGVS